MSRILATAWALLMFAGCGATNGAALGDGGGGDVGESGDAPIDRAECGASPRDGSPPGCTPADVLDAPSTDGAPGGTGGANAGAGGATGGTDGGGGGADGAIGGLDAAAPSPDGGTPDLAADSASPPDAATTFDTAVTGFISSGKYKAVAVTLADDGCKIDPTVLVTGNGDPSYWLPVDVAGGIMKVGNDRGEPPMPSLGSGPYGGAHFKLTRINHVKLPAPSTCEYDEDVTSTITNDAIDSFGLGVVDKQLHRTNCVEPAGVGQSCASTWSWRMVKGQ